MGVMVDGKWFEKEPPKKRGDGSFQRPDTVFRNWVTADGEAGPTGQGGFKAESGRYHLYVSWACGWAHRTLIMRHLKGLADHISLSVVHFLNAENGWTFDEDPDAIPDTVNDSDYLYQVYAAADPGLLDLGDQV